MEAIANHVWQSTLFAIAAGLVTVMCRNNSASVRYWIWFAAAAKFLVPFAALASIVDQLPLPQSPRAATAAIEAASMVLRASAVPAVPAPVVTAIIALWITGMCVVLISSMRQWRRLAAHARQSPLIADGIVHDTVRRVERAEGVRNPIAIVASNQSMEPGVIGIREPVLLWPQLLTSELSDAHIEAIVTHEVSHVIRRDNLLAFVQIAVSAVFWFHPLVWWISGRLIDERERACDERVLARGGRPAAYAESILTTCRLCLASPALNVPGVTGGDMKQRIVRIMQNTPVTPLGNRKKTALLLAAVLTVLPVLGSHGPRLVAAAPLQDKDREVERPGPRVTTPKLIREVKPHYPDRAKQDKVQGEVLMECVVKADGTVGDKKIIRALHPDLDQAAMDAAAQWLFEPGTRDGKPVNVLVTIAIAFTLK